MEKKLKAKISTLPSKPGIYVFKNSRGKIIYIGKALSLKSRVKSYFQSKYIDQKTRLLVAQIKNLDYQVVPSEIEALLLEAKLIKEYQPKYNVQLKDDKRSLYIAITKAPYRIIAVRQPELGNGLLYWLGPFPSGRAVREVLRMMRKIFPYCSCQKPPKRQCLYAHIGLCPGFENLSSQVYKNTIDQIKQFLNGKTSLLLRKFRQEMLQAAKILDYERAQVYKNKIQSLEYITQGWRPISGAREDHQLALLKLKRLLVRYQSISPQILSKIEGYDVSNLGRDVIVGAMIAFVDGQPDKGLYRKFRVTFRTSSPLRRMTLKEPNDPASIKEIVQRRLNHPEWLYPQLILVDGGKPQVSAAFQAIKKKGLAGQICVLGLAKKEERIIVPRFKNNLLVGWRQLQRSPRSSVLKLLQQIRDESHRFAQRYYQTLHRKILLS